MGAFVGCIFVSASLIFVGLIIADRMTQGNKILERIANRSVEEQAQNLIDQAKGKS